ncbi:MAG: hypothetical protein SVO01_09430 [Thermotogota bacterium]|nr:hypothetical protein [Chloroflexota bacterium]MDY6895619.1 hypothetical protein [Thermotogota bacterium]
MSRKDWIGNLIEDLHCSRCKIIIGKVVIIDDNELLQIDGLILKEAHGICCNCGAGFHYSLAEKRLKEILNHQRKIKKVSNE